MIFLLIPVVLTAIPEDWFELRRVNREEEYRVCIITNSYQKSLMCWQEGNLCLFLYSASSSTEFSCFYWCHFPFNHQRCCVVFCDTYCSPLQSSVLIYLAWFLPIFSSYPFWLSCWALMAGVLSLALLKLLLWSWHGPSFHEYLLSWIVLNSLHKPSICHPVTDLTSECIFM